MEDLEFQGPPSPVRLGRVQRTNEFFELIANESQAFSSSDVDDLSLSLLTGEVLQAQKCQVTELESKKQNLEKLEVELSENQAAFEVLSGEVSSMNRQIYLLQEELTETRKSCSSLEEGIKNMLADKKRKQVDLTSLKWNTLSDAKTLGRYRLKMKKYCESVENYLQNSEFNKQLKNLKDSVVLMERNSKEGQGFSFDELQGDCKKLELTIFELQETKSKLKAESFRLEKQLQKENENLLITQKELKALQKRDSSYVSRLNKQILDGEGRNETCRRQNRELREFLNRN